MARSSLLGIDRTPTRAPGHDVESLGPSDTSDSGSDLVGIDELDAADPGMPVDRALDDDRERPMTPPELIGRGSDSDGSGTGERASVAGDSMASEGADIAPDRIFGGDDADAEVLDAADLSDDLDLDEEGQDDEDEDDAGEEGARAGAAAGGKRP